MDKKIDNKKVRAPRNARAMSQAELAVATSLSLRTIQRIETTGIASLESKRSLASVFDVPISHLVWVNDERPLREQSNLGLILGGSSTLLAGGIASVCIQLGFQDSVVTHQEAGVAFAVVATIVGSSFALIGKLYSKTQARLT